MSELLLHEAWQLARTAPGQCATPDDLAAAKLQWHDAVVPGTVAGTLQGDLDVPGDYDAHDWWYRTTFRSVRPEPFDTLRTGLVEGGERTSLRFEGLATLAEVWLNGERILASRNMHRAHRVDVTGRLRDVNQLAIRFAALDAAPVPKKPRARWKTALVEQQHLRWHRTTFLGRMPGWNPRVAPVGPWRPIVLETAAAPRLKALELHAHARGSVGVVRLRATPDLPPAAWIDAAWLHVGEYTFPLQIAGDRLEGDFEIPDVALWWPHTHGTPALHECRLVLKHEGERHELALGRVGFKDVRVHGDRGEVRFVVNGTAVFCRGAAWVPADIVSLQEDPAALRATLVTARDAGANMLRIPGITTYPSEAFLALCDELGILVWHDFMFANLDYPAADADFRAEAAAEVGEALARASAHACIAAYCGGSEVAQQAAMMGLPAEHWTNVLFDEVFPAACARIHPGIPYFPSTPWGGALPFHVGTGIAHYYGVGAYRRPFSDARTARVKFAAECLAFANVPEAASVRRATGCELPAPHDPRWKARVPRDNGAGWDFEDVRDHYLRELWSVDPVALRSQDLARYVALSRVTSGEAMKRVFGEFRSAGNPCGGALVWTLRDPWDGAGWGVLDAQGQPKAAWWALRRAWASRAIIVTDEGLDGLALHVVNETAEPMEATVELELLRDGRRVNVRGQAAVRVPARGSVTLHGDALLRHFTDSTNAYRFGPPKHDVAVARLLDARGTVVAEDFHFPVGMALPKARAQVEAQARWEQDAVVLEIGSDAFLQFVAIGSECFMPDDNHFHVAPGVTKHVRLVPLPGAAHFEAELRALNTGAAVTVRAERAATASDAGQLPERRPSVA